MTGWLTGWFTWWAWSYVTTILIGTLRLIVRRLRGWQ